MLPFVCIGIGMGRTLKKRKLHCTVVNIVAVLTVIEKAHSVSVIGNIHVLMSADLKPRRIPACVFMRRALNRAELNFVGCLIGIDINIKSRLDHNVLLMPIGMGIKVDSCAVVIEPNLLAEIRLVELSFNTEAEACTLVDKFNRGNIVYLVLLLRIIV